MTLALGTRPLEIPPSGPPVRQQVGLAASLEEVDQLETAWTQLDRALESPLAKFSWMRSALAVFGDEAKPHVLTVKRGSKLVALAPLVRKRVRGVCRLFLAGVEELFEPADLIWTDERALARLTSSLAWSGSPLFFDRIPADSIALARLKRRFWCRAIILTRRQPPSPFIELDDTWLSPEHHLSARRRGDLRRARRKAEQCGEVTTEIHAPDLDELPRLLDTAIDVEARSWKGAAGTALAHDSTRAVFYRQYAQAACTEGTLRVCFLRIGDRVAAMQLAVEDCGGLWLLKVGYDERFASCSPGLLLMRETIRYAVEAGLSRYEFLGRAEAWTELWTTDEHPYVALRIYPLGVRGLTALVADAAATAYRRWSNR